MKISSIIPSLEKLSKIEQQAGISIKKIFKATVELRNNTKIKTIYPDVTENITLSSLKKLASQWERILISPRFKKMSVKSFLDFIESENEKGIRWDIESLVVSTSEDDSDYLGSFKRIIESIFRLPEGKYQQEWISFTRECPRSAFYNRYYAPSNQFFLVSSQKKNGYTSPLWATKEGWERRGKKLLKHEKPTFVYRIFFHPKSENQKFIISPLPLYNACQIRKRVDETENPFIKRYKTVERLLDRNKVKRLVGGGNAYFDSSADEIRTPAKEDFKKTKAANSEYYSAIFHELIHWTGVKKRLNRDVFRNYDDPNNPSKNDEEVIAELGAIMLRAEFKISELSIKNSCQYIKYYLNEPGENFKISDKECIKLIFTLNESIKAVRYLLAARNAKDNPDNEIF